MIDGVIVGVIDEVIVGVKEIVGVNDIVGVGVGVKLLVGVGVTLNEFPLEVKLKVYTELPDVVAVNPDKELVPSKSL